MKKIISLLLCTTLLCACFEDVGTDNKGSIAGTVLDYTLGDPIPVVNVVLKESNISTVTGTDGTFWFNNIPEGEYTIEISKNGYKPGERKVSVNAGETSEYHLLLERIPAIVTADRNVLDFGSNKSYNTMSFNIVNSSREDLEWSVEENCKWITEVKPNSGTLKFGGSETIVIVIDRDKLNGGTNRANIVVRSNNGSTEVKVIAEGEYKTVPSLETYEVTNIRAYSATLNGEITNPGVPEYTERGFVYSTEKEPTIEKCIERKTSPKNNDTKFSCEIKNLALDQTYYVRAYAINSKDTAYNTYDITFTTQPVMPKIETKKETNVTIDGTAIFHGNITDAGEPAYTERGFVWSTTLEPTIEDNYGKILKSGTGTGTFSSNVTDLPRDITIYVRAYAINEYETTYGNQIDFTINSVLPTVSTIEVADIDYTNASATFRGQVTNAGVPAYTERGFVYSTNPKPTIDDNYDNIVKSGTGTGTFSSNVTGLPKNKTLYLRAYAKSEAGVAYGISIPFSIGAELPKVKTFEIEDMNYAEGAATLRGEVENVGVPAYTERGFVWSTTPEPTINDNKIVKRSGTGTGTFSCYTTELPKNRTFFVRAYAKNQAGVAYGNEVSVSTEYIVLEGTNIMVQTKDLGKSDWDTANSMCENSTVGGYRDWRLPTLAELAILYNNKDKIGGFTTDKYWSSSEHNYYTASYYINFSNGYQDYDSSRYNYYVRAVRTIE